jgi:hypothetical protein
VAGAWGGRLSVAITSRLAQVHVRVAGSAVARREVPGQSCVLLQLPGSYRSTSTSSFVDQVSVNKRGSPFLHTMLSFSAVAMVGLTTPLAGWSCKLSLNIGREAGTWMPAEWAASGARLVLPFQVMFEEGQLEQVGSNERLLGGPDAPRRRLTPLTDPKFVDGTMGERTVRVAKTAAWCETPLGESGERALRFFVDFKDSATRQDVTFDAERVFCTTGYWPAGVLDATRARYDAVAAAIGEQQRRIDAHQDEVSRANPLQKALLVRKSVLLFDELSALNRRLNEAAQGMPDECGSIEGPGGAIMAKAGSLCVKRSGKLGIGEEYHILGTFTLSPVQ